MKQLSKKEFTELFESYEWAALYESVKDVEHEANKPIDSQYTLAIKAMLCAAWWGDHDYSKQLLSFFPHIIKEPLTHFAITYAYIRIGDIKMSNNYLKYIPKVYPVWMKNYLDIETLGRNLRYKDQIKTVNKLTPKNQYPKNYIKIALLQSLEQKKPDITYLQEWLKEISLVEDNDPLSIALCLKAGLIDVKEVDAKESYPLLSIKANNLLKSHEVIEALKMYDKLAKKKFLNINNINYWLSTSISIPQGRDSLLNRTEFAINLVPDSLILNVTISHYALIHFWINGLYVEAYNIIKKYKDYNTIPETKHIQNAQTFFYYILQLCVYWQQNQALYQKQLNQKELYTFGESHTLSFSNINIRLDEQSYHCNANFIMGIKMNHLSDLDSSYHSDFLIEHLNKIKPQSDVLFSIGEIDTRPDEGIWQVHLKKEKPVDEIIEDTVNGYINFLHENLKEKQLSSITIQGIPAPNYALEGDKDPKDEKGFLAMIKQVNEKLKSLTLQKGWNFLDVYSATVGKDGKSNKKWHIDGYHLSPVFYPSEADKWLIKPEVQEHPKPTAIDFSKYQTVSLGKSS